MIRKKSITDLDYFRFSKANLVKYGRFGPEISSSSRVFDVASVSSKRRKRVIAKFQYRMT